MSKIFIDLGSSGGGDVAVEDAPTPKRRSAAEAEATIIKSLGEVFDLSSALEMSMVSSILDEIRSMLRDDDDTPFEFARKAVENIKSVRRQMSPPGKLGIKEELLEARRWEYGIVDGAFSIQPCFDRIFLHQVSQFGKLKISKDSSLFLPHDGTNEKHSNPEGILIGAGLLALDQIRANGMDLGHKVTFLRLSPWHRRVAVGEGHEYYTLTMTAGDLIGSHDLMSQLRSQSMTIGFDAQKSEHFYMDENGVERRPAAVESKTHVPEDY